MRMQKNPLIGVASDFDLPPLEDIDTDSETSVKAQAGKKQKIIKNADKDSFSLRRKDYAKLVKPSTNA